MRKSNSRTPDPAQPSSLDRRQVMKSIISVAGSYVVGSHPICEASLRGNPARTDDAAKLTTRRRIDVHLHAILPEYTNALERAGVTEQSARKITANTPAACFDAIAELGIDVAIWLPFSGSGIYVADYAKTSYLTQATNNAIAVFASKFPRNFGFYAILPLPDVATALKQMDYALDTLHADGLAFLSSQNGIYIGDQAFDELYAEMNRRSVTAFIHPARPTYPAPLKLPPALLEYPFETTRAAVNLIYNGVMKRYPNIRWILAHAGGTLPYLSMRLEAQQENDPHVPSFLERVPEGYAPYLSRFYYDVAMAGSMGPASALTIAAEPSRLLYGSDWPYVSKEYIARQIVGLENMPQFAGDKLHALERQNAMGLFRHGA
jgi:6-methylsalicylate decarboxylase